MKKIYTLSLALALGAPLFAESLTVFKCEPDGIPGMTEPQLMGFSMAANGQYVCGTIEQGVGIFIGNCLTGEVVYRFAEESGGELRGIDNDGTGIGFLDADGVLYSFGTQGISAFEVPEGCRYILGEGISNGGDVKVGSLALESFNTIAAYSVGEGSWRPLPYPSDEELGKMKDNLNSIYAAKFVSGDGNVILGHLGSFTYPTLWKRNDAGEYIPDFFPIRFVKSVEADRYDESKPLYGIDGMYTCMSHNGRYVGTVGAIADESNTRTRLVPVIYDTENNTLKVYSERQAVDEYEIGLYPRAIADDGTFVGTVGQPQNGSTGSFIMRAGQEQAESFVEAFPEYASVFGVSDGAGFNTPTGISADGSKILGYTYYSDDLQSGSDAPVYWVTYVISTDATGVEHIESSDRSISEAIYSIDGRRLTEIEKGLNIVRNSDGSVSKILKK